MVSSMKNPLHKRFLRDLRSDCGKYIAVFLFLVLFIGIVSGFLVTDNSVHASYVESFTKYNIEDGHITFTKQPGDALLRKLEDANELRFTPLFYKNERLETEDGTKKTVRIYMPRSTVNTVCLMDGAFPRKADEIAVDRLFAETNGISVGDALRFSGKSYTVCGFVALPDYSCLYENNADMMFSAIGFGVGLVTDAGFAALGDAHLSQNYAWKYNTPYADDAEQDARSQAFMDSLEDILKAEAQDVLQAKADAVWDEAQTLAATLEPQFKTAAESIERKVTGASGKAVEKAVQSLSEEETFALLLEKSGMDEETFYEKMMDAAGLTAAQKMRLALDARTKGETELLAEAMEMAGKSEDDLTALALSVAGLTQEEAAKAMLDAVCKKKGTTVEALVAAELGTTADALKAMRDAFEDAQALTDDMDLAKQEPPKIDLDALENDADAGTGFDFSFDEIYGLLDKVDATKLYNTSNIRETLAKLQRLTDVRFDDNEIVGVRDYLPRYRNLAITFTGEDMGSDKASITLISYIVIAILAFVFAVTTSNTIQREAGAIGTLRASGFSRAQLVRHYLLLPVVVTVLASILGNVAGYTFFESLFIGVYYTNYSLVTYETLPSAEAFLQTTVTPLVMMLVINFLVLVRKLRVRPLDFLRGQTSAHSRKRAVRLSTKLSFLQRFRLRVLFQNAGAYAILFVGILFGGILAVFSMMFGPLMDSYTQLVRDTQLAAQQTIVVSDTVETKNADAEKFCLTTLDTTAEGFKPDGVSVYGIEPDSSYIRADIPESGVLASESMMQKYGLKPDDTVTLKEKYSSKTYSFRIAGAYPYQASLAVFLPRQAYLDIFRKDGDYFTGYFSSEPLTDLDAQDVAATITLEDLTKAVDQLQVSMLGVMDYFVYFGVIVFLLLMFLLTKQVIEKNGASIAMTKILGFKNGEIGRLYLVSTSIAVLASLLVSIPIISALLHYAFRVYIYKRIAGYIPFVVSNSCYVKLVVMGMASYLVVALGMLLKIKKVPMSEALKQQNL